MLSKEEYKYLWEYTDRYYSNYYDVKLEVIDHLASMIEEIRGDDPSIGFKSALNIAYKSFPGREFHKVITEKEKSLRKYWNKKISNFLIGYIRWPMIIKTTALALVIFTTLSIIPPNGALFNGVVGIGLVLILGIAVLFRLVWNFLRSKEEQFLSVKTYLGVASGLWLIPIYLVQMIEIFDLLNQVLISLVSAFIFILLYGLLFHFPKQIKQNILDNYQDVIPSIT